MKSICAALLLALGGKEINPVMIKTLLSSVGIQSNEREVKLICEYCKKKKVEDIIKEGAAQLGQAIAGASAAPAEDKKDDKKDDKKKGGDKKDDKKKKEKEKPKEEEEEDVGLGDLF